MSYTEDSAGRSTNFSRPFPSPNPIVSSFPEVPCPRDLLQSLVVGDTATSTELDDLKTPTKISSSTQRPALGELYLSSSRLNLQKELFDGRIEAGTIAANRLIDFTRGTVCRSRLEVVSPRPLQQPRHNRRLSKTARNPFSLRAPNAQEDGSDPQSSRAEVQTELGGRSRPIMHFRPNLWRHLERNRQTLNLDLFWPLRLNKEEASEEIEAAEADIFPIQELRPLCEFRQLRSLQLNGMLQSYQKYIWQTCWLNPGLEELTLEMALKPSIGSTYSVIWPSIEGNWHMKGEEDCSVEYLGFHGDGILHEEFGVGEYLDKQAIALAKLETSLMSARLQYLPVVRLVLSGFVVDAGPFFQWFDMKRLRQVDFKYNCVDAGFSLPASLTNMVKVKRPDAELRGCTMIKVTRVARENIRTITLKKGKRVNETSGLKPKINAILSHRWFMDSKRISSREELIDSVAGEKIQISETSTVSGHTCHSEASGKG